MKLTDIKKYFTKEVHNDLVFMKIKDGYEWIMNGQDYSYYVILADNTVLVRAKDDKFDEYEINLPHVNAELLQRVIINKVTRKEVYSN